ncbi:MAG: pantoate--beta-alanine ligase [Desulfobacula sp.]|nr:pantoate--beta-alanine ligase [Desulfobacula sp.]
MEILKTKPQMQHWSKQKKRESKTICFVPTMGYLHKGHTSLLDKGKPLCDELVLSIFVNPTQFGPKEDLDAYPSDIENDLALAKKAGVTAVFLPNKESIYPKNFQTQINLQHLPQFLCGKFRPVHFGGVATVVAKLFNIVMPDIAIFGQKDYQQLQIIRQLTLDLDFDIKILGGQIIREQDGLAMSSRNAYLTDKQRASAICLSKALNLAKELVVKGEKKAALIQKELQDFIHAHSETAVEYISFCDPATLEKVEQIDAQVLLALAVKVGATRLIDNSLIG